MRPVAVLGVLVKAMGVAQTNKAIGTTDKTLKSANRRISEHERAWAGVKTGAKVGTVAVGLAGAAALNAAGNFEKSLNVFQATTKATGREMKRVSALSIKLGADIKLPATSAKDAAEAMTELAKGGLSVKDSLGAARGVLQLSAAAEIDNAEAAKIAARALNAFGLEGKKAGKISDLLAASANASTAEISDIALALQQSSASAHQLRIPIQDLTTNIAQMANAGIAGSDAGTSLKTLMTRLVPQTLKASKAMEDYGLATENATGGFDSKFFNKAGEFVGIRKAIQVTTKALGGLSVEERSTALATIFGSDARRAASIVLAGGTKAYDKMHKAVTRQGAAQDMATAKTKGFKGSLEAFKSTLETLAITFGTILLPAATKVMRFLSVQFGKLGEHKKAVLILVAALGALSAFVLVVAGAMKVYTAVTLAWAAATGIASAAAYVLSFALLALRAPMIAIALLFAANPFVVVSLAILALGAALVVAYKKSATFRSIVASAFEAVKVAGKALITTWMAIKSATTAVWGVIGPYVKRVLQALGAVFMSYFGIYKSVVVTTWKVLSTVTRAMWTAIAAVLKVAFTVIAALFRLYVMVWSKVVTAAWNAIKSVAGPVWDAIGDKITGPMKVAATVLKAVWDKIKSAASSAWEKLKSGAGSFAGKFVDIIVSAFEGAVNKVIDFVNAILGVLRKIPGINKGNLGNIEHIGGGIVDANTRASRGQGNLGQTGHMAKGGAYARTGGMVTSPITLMGEEAPRHPEFVIPTNPAYKRRAQGLVGQAAKAVGLFGGGTFDAAKGAVSDAAGALNPLKLVSKLPNPADMLPDWLRGTGKFAIKAAASYIKDKVSSLGGLFGGGSTKGPKGVGVFEGVPMANWVIGALRYARSKGFTGHPTSGYRPGFDPHTATGTSEHQGTQYPHGAVDFGGFNTGGDIKRAFTRIVANYKYPLINPIGFHDEGHASGTGHKKGGIFQALKKGGTFGLTQLANLWDRAGGSSRIDKLMAHIAIAESGGDPNAHNKSGATGLWQILGAMVRGNLYDPFVNAKNAVAKYGAQGLGAWAASKGTWGKFLNSDRSQNKNAQQLKNIRKPGVGKLKAKGKKAIPKLPPAPARDRMTPVAAKLMKKIGKIGLPKGLEANLAALGGTSDIYSDLADRAGQLTTDDAIGSVNGKDQLGWLQEQLGTLLTWRNALIEAEFVAAVRRNEVIERIHQARAILENVTKNIRFARAVRAKLAHEYEVKSKHPKGNRKRLAEIRRIVGGIDKEQEKRFKVRDDLKTAIGAGVTRAGDLATARTGFLDTLSTVQGAGSPMGKMASLPAVGVLGGAIFDVQMRAQQIAGDRNVKATAKAVDSTDDGGKADLFAGLLRDANLRTAASEKAFEVFKGFPPYGGSFASGGVVPGPSGAPAMILAHGGETVTPEGAAGGTNITLKFAPGTEWLRNFVKVEVEKGTRSQSRAARGLPGRPGSLG